MVANNSGAAIHPEADEEDMKTFSNLLGVKIEQSSIKQWNSICLIRNSSK